MYLKGRKVSFKAYVVPTIQYAILDAPLAKLAFKMDYIKIKQAIKF